MEIETEPTWDELLGSNKWEGLLDPLNLSLRKLILHCGDMSQATYDNFISNPSSKYCGLARFGPNSLFKKVFLPDCASVYKITSFLYATATATTKASAAFLITPKYHPHPRPELQTNWMGYIAVTTDEVSKKQGRRDIIVAWRGTIRPLEKEDVLHFKLVPATPLMSKTGADSNDNGNHDEAKVMDGWIEIYTTSNPAFEYTKDSAQTQVINKLKELVKLYEGEKVSIIFTGHSLGGALAAISAFNVVETGVVGGHVRFGVFVFGCPMLGNKAFCDKLEALGVNLRVLHVKNARDIIPNSLAFVKGFDAYTGIQLALDSTKSPFLKASLSPFVVENWHHWHSLQGVLHVVAGWNGREGKFEMKVKRSVALVNKGSNFLKEECEVVEKWWVEKNRRMAVDEKGEWVELEPFQED